MIKINKSGLSIIETAVGLAILGIAVGATFYSLRTTQKQLAKVENATGFEGSLALALKELRQVVGDVGVDGNQGICRTMTTRMESGGVGFISVNLPEASNDPFKIDWTRVFGDTSKPSPQKGWLAGSNCGSSSTSYQRCFVPAPKDALGRLAVGLTDNLMEMNPRFKFVITPVVVRGSSTGGYAPLAIPNTTQDARDAAFLLTTQVSFDVPQQGVKTQEQFSLVWMGEYRCKKSIAGRTVVISPSAIGSGSASSDGLTSELFSTTQAAQDAVIQGSFLTMAYTEGYVKTNRAETHEETDYTASGACIEHIFRCPQAVNNRKWVDNIQSSILARYNPNNGVIFTSSVTAVPSVTIQRSSGNGSSFITNTAFSLDGVSVGAGGGMELLNIRRNITGSISSENVCPQVCAPENAYNAKSSSDPYKMIYDFSMSGGKVHAQIKDTGALGCSCCFGKQCAAIGTRVSGWCSNQPPEPVDSRLPECASANPAYLTNRFPIESSPSFEVPAGLPPNACLAVTYSDKKSRLVLEARDCSESLKYLCYSQGVFQIAAAHGAEVVGSYSQAAQKCYDLGWETVSKTEVDDKLRDQGNFNPNLMPPTSGTQYDFLNASLAGLFIAPQSDENIASAITTLSSAPKFDSIPQRFWIALKTNASQKIVAAIPEMAGQTSEYSTFMDAWGHLNFVRYSESFGHKNSSGARTAMVLHHSPRYFGAAAVEPVQTDNIAVLCVRPTNGAYFRSRGKTAQLSEAPQICKNEGGAFYAPISPLQWTAAMMEIRSIDPMLPWPSRVDGENLTSHSAWLALRRDSESDSWKPAYRMGSSTYRMSAWGEPIPDNVKMPPTLQLCRTSGQLRLAKMGENCVYDQPKNEIEDLELLALLQEQSALNTSTSLQVAPAPPSPPSATGP